MALKKVAVEGTIAGLDIKPKKAVLKLKDLSLTDGQFDKLSRLTKEGDPVKITIEEIQAKLDGTQ